MLCPTSPTRSDVIYNATIEVAPAVVTAVATTIVSFLPVFFLTGRDYRLFSPLAYTKTFAIAAAMMTAITIVPALSRLLLKSAGYPKQIALGVGDGALADIVGDDVAFPLGSTIWQLTLALTTGLSPCWQR